MIQAFTDGSAVPSLTNQFASIDLHPSSVPDRAMSDIDEDLIRKFTASVNERAGEFMTPRDVVRLATQIVIATDEDILEDGFIRSIYDPTCGTLGFLSDDLEQIRELSAASRRSCSRMKDFPEGEHI